MDQVNQVNPSDMFSQMKNPQSLPGNPVVKPKVLPQGFVVSDTQRANVVPHSEDALTDQQDVQSLNAHPLMQSRDVAQQKPIEEPVNNPDIPDQQESIDKNGTSLVLLPITNWIRVGANLLDGSSSVVRFKSDLNGKLYSLAANAKNAMDRMEELGYEPFGISSVTGNYMFIFYRLRAGVKREIEMPNKYVNQFTRVKNSKRIAK